MDRREKWLDWLARYMARRHSRDESEASEHHDPNYIEHRNVRLISYIDSDGVIRDKVFAHCNIYGPAVLIEIGKDNVIANCRLPAPDVFLWDIGTESKQLVGGVVVENCMFSRCNIIGVGMAVSTGTKELYTKAWWQGQ